MSPFYAQFVSAAVVGAISPLPTLATVLILSGPQGVRRAIAFLAGWTAVLLALGLLIPWLLGGVADAVGDAAKASVSVVIGLVLVSISAHGMVDERHPLHGDAPASLPGWLRDLDGLSTLKSFGVGAVLLVVSPANIAAYVGALQGLAGIDVSRPAKFLVCGLLIAAVDLCIVVPIVVYVALPDVSAARALESGKRWLTDNQRRVVNWVLLAFGVLLFVSGASHLL